MIPTKDPVLESLKKTHFLSRNIKFEILSHPRSSSSGGRRLLYVLSFDEWLARVILHGEARSSTHIVLRTCKPTH